MCGIAGIINRDVDAPVSPVDLTAMAAAMRHRGPDAEGTLLEGSVGFTMRRLKVIDLETGDQPIWNEDRTVGVVQNGEIYNFEDLRDELTARGHTFATASDTEAIVHLYEEAGPDPDLPARLWGMFAFALFDRERQIVVLARDRAGKKPLFLYRDEERLGFASEIAALFAPEALRMDDSIDPAAVDAYLALQYVPGPGTIFRRVRHLPPGSLLILERAADGWRERDERRYWDLGAEEIRDRATALGFSDAVRSCEAQLDDAVRRRMVSDVPLGAFLSGGIDSSLIVALMARAARGRVRTFSIGFDESGFDESPAAEAVARHVGAEHRTLMMPSPGAEDVARILGAFDQPLADPAVVPTWYLSEMTRRDVTVALSGEGADEVFGGYHWYRRKRRLGSGGPSGGEGGAAAELYRRRERTSRDARLALLAGPLRAEIRETSSARDSYLEAAEGLSDFASIATLQAVDFRTWMADDLLVKVDRMSMAHSLEVRCPYLDHRLVEAALPGPNRHKIRWGRRKALLRAVARRHLPAAIVKRRKHGFLVPIDRLLRGALRESLLDLTGRDRLERQAIFDGGEVEVLLARWEGDPTLARRVWKLFCFQVWWETRSRTRR
jgi:asparagine synthase (glutamine-hydrolysing)